MSMRLSYDVLGQLPQEVDVVASKKDVSGVGIVHMGIGAFHRAHQAVFTEDAIKQSGGDWKIAGVSLRSAGVRDQMAPQDCLYSVTEKSSSGNKTRIVSVVDRVLVAPENPAAVVDLLANPCTKVVTLTVTEKGYCYDIAGRKLNTQLPDIQSDLANLSQPKTMPGFIVAACQARKAGCIPGFTLLSCDNLSHNGKVARQVVLDLAERIDPSLRIWIEDNVAFPCSMVDRIVPATTEADRQEIAGVLSVDDQAAVTCEPFKQWVIEDNFINGRPGWEAAGALLVPDVTPFEDMKLRLLNGNHSALAYLGYLSGYEFIHEAIGDKDLHEFIRRLIQNEIAPTLAPPEDFDLVEYQELIISRFCNSGVKYKTTQVATDGSQKLQQRLLEFASDNLNNGRSISGVALVVAAWFRYMKGLGDNGVPIPVSDPMAEQMREAFVANEGDCLAQVNEMIKVSGIFHGPLHNSEDFVLRVVRWLQLIVERGAKAAILEYNS